MAAQPGQRLLVTTTSNCDAHSTISFLFLVDTLYAISAQYVLMFHQENKQSKERNLPTKG